GRSGPAALEHDRLRRRADFHAEVDLGELAVVAADLDSQRQEAAVGLLVPHAAVADRGDRAERLTDAHAPERAQLAGRHGGDRATPQPTGALDRLDRAREYQTIGDRAAGHGRTLEVRAETGPIIPVTEHLCALPSGHLLGRDAELGREQHLTNIEAQR